jgi:hypothetical protein
MAILQTGFLGKLLPVSLPELPYRTLPNNTEISLMLEMITLHMETVLPAPLSISKYKHYCMN